MGLHVVAEGVETQLQAAELRSLGCSMGQGWLFSRAVTADQLAALIERGIPRSTIPRSRRQGLRRAVGRHPGMRTRAQPRLIDEMLFHVGLLENET